MKTNGLRTILIYGLTRKQLINFILHKDNSYLIDDFVGLSDKQIRNIVLFIDKQVQLDRQLKRCDNKGFKKVGVN